MRCGTERGATCLCELHRSGCVPLAPGAGSAPRGTPHVPAASHGGPGGCSHSVRRPTSTPSAARRDCVPLARPEWSVAQERHDRGTGEPGYQAEPGNVTCARAGSEPGSDQRDRHSRNLALRYASRSARMGFRSGVRGRVRDSPASDQCTSESAAGATPGRSRERRGARGGVPR